MHDPRLLGRDEDFFFPWKRYWAPENQAIQLETSFWRPETDAYLADPEETFLGKAYNGHLKETADLLRCRAGCLVLCGDPGMGKSRALTQHFSGNFREVLFVEFRHIADWSHFVNTTVGTTRWAQWREGKGNLALVVDGVDEGLIKIDGFVDALNRLLRVPLNQFEDKGEIDRMSIVAGRLGTEVSVCLFAPSLLNVELSSVALKSPVFRNRPKIFANHAPAVTSANTTQWCGYSRCPCSTRSQTV